MELQKSYGSPSDGLTTVKYSPNGQYLASATNDTQPVTLWDAKTNRMMRRLPQNLVSCLSFSPDSKILATGSWDTPITLWDTSTGQALKSLRGHTAQVYAVSFHPQGKMLASGGREGIVNLWKVAP